MLFLSSCFFPPFSQFPFLVSFYKRAQILVGDVWACFKGKDLGSFSDIDAVTMFADYRYFLAFQTIFFHVVSNR